MWSDEKIVCVSMSCKQNTHTHTHVALYTHAYKHIQVRTHIRMQSFTHTYAWSPIHTHIERQTHARLLDTHSQGHHQSPKVVVLAGNWHSISYGVPQYYKRENETKYLTELLGACVWEEIIVNSLYIYRIRWRWGEIFGK